VQAVVVKHRPQYSRLTLPAHSASLGMTFYNAAQFPADYRGNIFAAEHGSWNRGKRTGYKIIRVIVKMARPQVNMRTLPRAL
jgi:glucose/arabinose dehydrogenase